MGAAEEEEKREFLMLIMSNNLHIEKYEIPILKMSNSVFAFCIFFFCS